MTPPRPPAFRQFTGANGTTETTLLLEAREGGTFAAQLRELQDTYAEILASLRLGPESAIYRRLFLSDILNQQAAAAASPLAASPAGAPCAVSLLQQRPLPDAKIALLAYHLSGPAPLLRRRISPRHLLVEKAGLRHLWSTGLGSGRDEPPVSAEEQTAAAFDDLAATLAREGGSLRDNAVRTWIFVKEIDLFYRDVLRGRQPVFARAGLGAGTHTLASTAIAGAGGHPFDVVTMDAYSVLGLHPGQMSFLKDLGAMCATEDYGVSFERGTRLAYADRAHLFLSGTASIDRAGQVVHPGDVEAQLDRALSNRAAVLRAGGATLADLTHALVYLRDPSDAARIRPRLAERLPGVPAILLHAPVCRPQWLVEIEGIATIPHHDPALPEF